MPALASVMVPLRVFRDVGPDLVSSASCRGFLSLFATSVPGESPGGNSVIPGLQFGQIRPILGQNSVMNIRITSGSQMAAVSETPLATTASAVATTAPSTQDEVSLSGVDSLKQALASLPAVRPEKVELGKSLIADPSYPSDETLDRMASLLSDKIMG
jgi:hypothetical protein